MNIKSTVIFKDVKGYRHAIDSTDIICVTEVGQKKEDQPTANCLIQTTEGSLKVPLSLDQALSFIAKSQGI